MSYYKPPIIVPNIGEDRKRGVGNNGMGQVITEAYANKRRVLIYVAARLTACVMFAVAADGILTVVYGDLYMQKVYWVYIAALVYICWPLKHYNDHIQFCENGYIFNGISYNMYELGRMFWFEDESVSGKLYQLNMGGEKIDVTYIWQVRSQHHRAYNVEDNFLYTAKCINQIQKKIDSPEKKEVARIVRETVPDDAEYTPLYAYWYETYPDRDVCKYYAIGFCSEKLYVVPITYGKKRKMITSQHFVIEKKKLGRIETLRDHGPINRMRFYDKNGNELLAIWVERSNIKLDECSPVNIRQRDEAMAFIDMICKDWKNEVRRY